METLNNLKGSLRMLNVKYDQGLEHVIPYGPVLVKTILKLETDKTTILKNSGEGAAWSQTSCIQERDPRAGASASCTARHGTRRASNCKLCCSFKRES